MSQNTHRYQLLGIAAHLESWTQKLTAVLRDALSEIAAIRRELAAMSPPAPMPGPVKHLGEIVKWLRVEARLLRRQLGDEIGVSASTIRNIESGRHPPTAATLRRLLTAPCLAPLPELAKSAGLDLSLGDNGIDEPRAQPKEPPDLTNLARLGELVRRLREAGALTRAELSAGTGISIEVIRKLEAGKNATPHTWKALLAHPSMHDLPEMAKRQGLTLDFLDTADKGGN